MKTTPLSPIAPLLLAWYYENRRTLPFREDPTPYHIWVSEIMLQQTRVAAALPYYERFMAALPTVAALAAADEETLHKLWEGLGYYSRARNLHKAAVVVMEQHGGALPADYDALLALPGIGAYTAGAIASIAFGLPAVAVDGNVLRVFSRLLADEGDVSRPDTKRRLAAEVQRQQPANTPGDYNQALMELGALVCLPGNPACGGCPLAGICEGNRRGIAARLPVLPPKKAKTEHPVCVLVIRGPDGRVLLQKRPATGLLAGLWQPLAFEQPLTRAEAEARLGALFPAAKVLLGSALPKARHIFTHRIWQLYGWQATVDSTTAPGEDYRFATAEQLAQSYALPNAFKAYRPLLFGGKTSENDTD